MKNSNIFDHYHTTINQWHKRHRKTSPSTTLRIRKRFDKFSFEYAKTMAEYRKTRSPSVLATANNILQDAEKEFKILKKLELLGTLYK